jgi:4-hydroxy 2-oxovalerate aldolase
MSVQELTGIPTVLDVTLRDGGYVNGHSWSTQQAAHVVEAAARAGVWGAEVGYFRPGRHAVDGDRLPSASCPPRYLARLHALAPPLAMVVMVHRAEVELSHYGTLAELGVEMVRLPTKTTEVDQARAHVDAIHDAGMTATVNLLRISEPCHEEIAAAADAAERAGPDVMYIADSNGSLFPESVDELVRLVRGHTDRPIGFHAHDGLSLAFINTLAAMEAGCTYVDASLGGMGKGGGNLKLELIGVYLRARLGAEIVVSPLAETAQEVLARFGRDGGCETIVSSLLNLNIDEIARVCAAGDSSLVGMLDAPADPVIARAGAR